MNQALVSPETEETVSATPASRPLVRLLDRCDRCGAQAYHRATHLKTGNELLFCNHHGTKFQATLGAKGFHIDDQSESLFKDTKPNSSAAA